MGESADNYSLATELLREIKASARRWFIAFCIMVGLEVITIAGFIWYITLPTDEVSIENEDGNANYIGGDLEGGLYNGENNSEAPSNQE